MARSKQSQEAKIRQEAILTIPEALSIRGDEPWYVIGPDTLLDPHNKKIILASKEEFRLVNKLLQAKREPITFGISSMKAVDRLVLAEFAETTLDPTNNSQTTALLRIKQRVCLRDLREHKSHDVPLPTSSRSVEYAKAFVREQLHDRGYVCISELEIGLGNMAPHIKENYFDAGLLKVHENDIPKDRERSRFVARYAWLPKGVIDTQYGVSSIENGLYLEHQGDTSVGERSQSNIAKRPKDYSTFDALADPQWIKYITTMLGLVPPHERMRFSTFAINLFRTHSDVVASPHQDEEQCIIIYCIDVVGGGARTQLFPEIGSNQFSEFPAFSRTLTSGDILIFLDRHFKHVTSPLIPPPNGEPCRDVIVSTVDYPDTHKWTSDQKWGYNAGI